MANIICKSRKGVKVEIKKKYYWNCCLKPSQGFGLQIEPQPTRWQYPLINYPSPRTSIAILSVFRDQCKTLSHFDFFYQNNEIFPKLGCWTQNWSFRSKIRQTQINYEKQCIVRKKFARYSKSKQLHMYHLCSHNARNLILSFHRVV